MPKNLFSIFKILIKLLLTAGALYWVFSNVDTKALGATLAQADPIMLFGSFIAFFFSQLFASSRVRTFFECIGIELSEWLNYKLYLLGMFYNMFLPGGIGGDGYKIFLLRKDYGVETRKLVMAVFMDKLSGLWALTILLLVLLSNVSGLPVPAYWAWLLIGAGTAGYYLMLRLWFKQYSGSFVKIHLKALGGQTCQLLCALFILYTLRVEGALLPYLLLFMASSLLALFPLTIGGLGARELVFMYGAKYFVLDPQIAITISLLFYSISALSSLPGAYFVFHTKTLSKDYVG
ncbi:hypothetical protein SAMN04488522_102247 [Pedobacter caeni]|uniref:Lysylphosphatidylglycerol synthase TM region n=2 Tax=Pedobacter caeni TaxID=288992 RepID=A0A1M4Z9X2_9SPHI|nr:hypothetical protein SAMN04488522_102247 [Pedobacter caeni]